MVLSIFSRYSCRKFSEKPVTEEQLTAIARAGMCAPTARNERPWEFLIVRSKEGRKKIAEASPYAESCLEAQAVIIALANSRRISQDSPWWIQDMSACVENMLLEITELGLGGVWLGMYPRQDRVNAIVKAFELEPEMIPFAAVPVGYPDKKYIGKERFESERIRWEQVKSK